MEKNHDILKNALTKLPYYVPGEGVWKSLEDELDELPLKSALKTLPEYEPDDKLWAMITEKSKTWIYAGYWKYAAAVTLLLGIAGAWLIGINAKTPVVYRQEWVDSRLQADAVEVTDQQYEKLKAYCETETLVCNNDDYKRLQQEYEKLTKASGELEQAIGQYNTAPELVRQFTTIEQQKANILNEMAKLI
jgi:hypothetical protein